MKRRWMNREIVQAENIQARQRSEYLRWVSKNEGPKLKGTGYARSRLVRAYACAARVRDGPARSLE